MSDHDRKKREWRFYLEDMIEFTLKIVSFRQGCVAADSPDRVGRLSG